MSETETEIRVIFGDIYGADGDVAAGVVFVFYIYV
jgi:hypothetical protein